MLKQTALDFVGKPTTGIAVTKVPGDPGDVALDGALVRAFDGIDDAAQQAAPRRAGLAAGTTRQLAGHAEIPIKRNAIHGWVLSILLRYSHPYKTHYESGACEYLVQRICSHSIIEIISCMDCCRP